MPFSPNRLPIKNSKFIFLTVAALAAAVCFFAWAVFEDPAFEQDLSFLKEKKYIQVMFAGDLMFDRGIRYYAQKNNGNEFIFDKISPLLKSSDLVIVNLEGPITNNKSVSSGTVPGSVNNYFFTFDPSLAKTLFDENIKLVSLGNNHITNFGKAGAESTEEYLADAGVDYFGSPHGKRIAIEEFDDLMIAFISYNQFAGNPEAEESEALGEIARLRPKVDFVFVFSHWGNEYQPQPAEETKNLAHRFIDAGADLVIGSHPHVIQPMEEYKEKRIYYSLGNFVFDQYFDENVRNGLGVVVQIDKNAKQLNFSEKHFYLDSNGQTSLVGEAGN